MPDRRGLRRVRRPLVGQRHLAVRRRQQPGEHQRGGQRVGGAHPVGRRHEEQPLRAQATWMLAGEQDSAVRYGLRPDRKDPAWRSSTTRSCRSPGAPSVTTRRGSRPSRRPCSASCCCRPRPAHRPTSRATPSASGRRCKEATAGKGYDQQFGDYLLMYGALAGQDDARAALDQVRTLDDKWVDDGNSRSVPARLADGAGALRVVAAQPNRLGRNAVTQTARSACSGRTRTRR